MRSSTEIDLLAEALADAQGEYPVIAKDHTAKIPTKSGGEYSYSYADLADTVEAAKKINATHGLSVAQLPEWDGTDDLLSTRVMHSSGQWIEASMRLFLSNEDPQSHGSALTYAKRYAYCAALGIVADVDDDGAAATSAAGESGASHGGNPPRGPRPSKAISAGQIKFVSSLLAKTNRDLLDLTKQIGREEVAIANLSMDEAKVIIDHLKPLADGAPDPDRPPTPTRRKTAEPVVEVPAEQMTILAESEPFPPEPPFDESDEPF